jgi:N-acetylglutamate synthase-like GNAT family acetyltransferase
MIRRAADHEAEALVCLINLAFRVEKFFIETDRIDLPQVRDHLDKGVFLIAEENGEIAGCVYVKLRGERGYFGLLSVEPSRQRSGLGRRLIAAAEAFARDARCSVMDLWIVNLREELPAYYSKLGYSETGTLPFPPDVETKLPCHFIQMTKALA